MLKKYTYKNRNTGVTISTNELLIRAPKGFELVTEVRNTSMQGPVQQKRQYKKKQD